MYKPGARLKKNAEFQRVYKNGKSYANRLLVVYVLNHPEDQTRRIGFSISKRVGNAVTRNSLRRRILEAYRLNQGKIQDAIDLIIIPRKPIVGASYAQIEKGLIKLFAKAGILK